MNATAQQLATVRSAHGRDSAYWGERGSWLIAYSTTRDSDCLNRSNYRTMLKLLGGTGTEGAKGTQDINEQLAVEESTHWACGWVQRIVIAPDAAELIAIATAALERLENYPVLDEEDFSELEMEEANEVWERCYSVAERVKYIRAHPSQFEFRDFGDMLGCARGRYFAGYASELIN